jgi:hypothetical protein
MPSAALERSLPPNTSRLQKPGATSTAWQRAVEKLSHRETELKNRIRTRTVGEPGDAGNRPLAKAHRERPSHISAAALDRFDELWELLGKSGTPSTSTGAINDSGLAPLPRSSSLVVLAA